MTIHWDKLLPVFVSIGIIIAVAILRQYSRTLAAIAATMPINIPLGMWIVYAGADDPQAALKDFSQAVLINIVPTIGFMLVAWWMIRTGGGLVPALAAGYAAWAVGLVLIFLARQVIG
jgi:positive regulator of sigma E activity